MPVSKCKLCRKAYNQAYHQNNIEIAHDRNRLYREEHRDALNARQLQWWAEHSAAHNAMRREKRAANLDGERAKDRARYHQKRKNDLVYQEKKKVMRQAYHVNNPDKAREHYHRREARKKNLPGHFTAAEWRTLKAKYQYRCLCCGITEQEAMKKYHARLSSDHVIPTTWPGSTNGIENIQPLCWGCNAAKSDHHATDYRETDFAKALAAGC
jgi:hypothetical protein